MDAHVRARSNELTLFAFLATVVMLFAGFTAAYLIRRTAADWRPVSLPMMFWFNTAVLAASSVTVELARRTGSRRMLLFTLALGLAFVAGQLLAWGQLVAAGFALPATPHGSFVYVLSGVHGVHVLGGLAALLLVAARGGAPVLAATYWHFVGAVWAYVLIVLCVL